MLEFQMNWKAVCSLFKYSITIHQPTKSKIILLIYHRLLGLSMKALMVLVGTFICLEYLASVSIFLSVLILATLPSALLLMDSFSHCWQLPHLSSISSGTEHQYHRLIIVPAYYWFIVGPQCSFQSCFESQKLIWGNLVAEYHHVQVHSWHVLQPSSLPEGIRK